MSQTSHVSLLSMLGCFFHKDGSGKLLEGGLGLRAYAVRKREGGMEREGLRGEG